MKLDLEKPVINKDNLQQEHLFGIEDTGMIFNILRNKMYSNKIMAICKEISCNARDAHREVRKMDVPIEITVPTTWEPNFKVKDFGPGISPDRMVNIFINYASSTKRSDNVQIGGFGLGSKTPFSYGDSFTIITTVDGIKYSYSAYIDETLIGKLALLNKEATTEPNGTEIIVPVKNQDTAEFERCCTEVFQHWGKEECENSIRPIIHGHALAYEKTPKTILEDKNWKLYEDQYNYNLRIEFVIDGIKYPLDLSSFKAKKYWKEMSNICGFLVMYFPTGVISIAANRESIDLTPKTEEIISKLLEEFVSSLQSKLEAKIANAKDFWEASELYETVCQTFYNSYNFYNNAPKLYWNNIKLIGRLRTNYNSYKFLLTELKDKKTNTITKNIYRQHAYDIWPTKTKFKIFINDTGKELKDIKNNNIQKIFDKYPDLEEVIIVGDGDYKHCFLPYIKVIDHSQLTEFVAKAKEKASNTTPSSSNTRITFYKYNLFKGDFVRTSIEAIKDDTNVKAYIQFGREIYNREIKSVKINNREIKLHKILPMFNGMSLYGFEIDEGKDKIKKIDKKILSFKDLIMHHAQIKIKPDLEQIKYAKAMENYVINRNVKMTYIDQIIPLLNQDGLFKKYFEASNNVKMDLEKFNKISDTFDLFSKEFRADLKSAKIANVSGPNLKEMSEDIYKKYPLIKYVDEYYGDCRTALAGYINLVDELEKIKNDTKGNK